MMLRKLFFLIVLLIVNAVMIYGTYLKIKSRMTVPQEMVAQQVPDFTWKDFSDKSHDIKGLSGKVVVLHFWATWCGPCRSEFPELLKAASQLGPEIVFLTVSGDDDKPGAEKFIAEAQARAGVKPDNVLYAFDAEKTISFDIFQTAVYPESIIVDKSGKMRRKFAGTADWLDKSALGLLRSYAH